jgi:hypothetical protein
MKLFHVSEEPGIALFEPRPVPSPDAGVEGDAVWAIDEEHLANYLLPRDCPRICYAVGPRTTKRDAEGFFDNTSATRIIVAEQAWLARILTVTLCVYEFSLTDFELADRIAGYYVCRAAVAPIAVHVVNDVCSEMAQRACQLRFVPDLLPIRDNVLNSTLDYSLIRMRNAGTFS